MKASKSIATDNFQIVKDVKGSTIIDPAKFDVTKTKIITGNTLTQTATVDTLVSLKRSSFNSQVLPRAKKAFEDFTIGFAAEADVSKVFKKVVKPKPPPAVYANQPLSF